MPSGCNVCNSRIQKLSFFCLWFSFQLGLWSMRRLWQIQNLYLWYYVNTKYYIRLKIKPTSVRIRYIYILLFIVFVLFYEVCRGQLFAQTGQALLRSEDTSNHEVKLSNIQFPFRGSRYSSLYVSTIGKETFARCYYFDNWIMYNNASCMWQSSRAIFLNVICIYNVS
jgi:hypothetical protein